MTRKAIAITVILFLAALAIGWMRAAVQPFDPRSLLPFLHGPGPLVYDCGGLALVILFIWGLCRMMGRSSGRNDPVDTPEAGPGEPEDPDSVDGDDQEGDQP